MSVSLTTTTINKDSDTGCTGNNNKASGTSIDPSILSKLIIDTTKPVLVTGATGYLAGVLIQQLLELGITVHATVRDASKKERYQYIQDVTTRINKGSIHFFTANLLVDGSFVTAMSGCTIVFHTASPVLMEVNDPVIDLVEPAVYGTKNVLTTASQISTVSRVVYTSSSAAISGSAAEGYNPAIMGTKTMLNENNWNRTSTLYDNPYAFSKTLAEQAAWVIAGSQTQWTLVTINPTWVIGPGLISTADKPSDSNQAVLKLVGNGNTIINSGTMKIGTGYVDVRDVATSHIAAAYNPNATGRYLCNNVNGSADDIPKILLTRYSPLEYPIPTFKSIIPKWLVYIVIPYFDKHVQRSFVWNNFGYDTNFDNTKIQQELGIKFRPINDSICEMYQQFIDHNIVIPITTTVKKKL